ncbi:MAG: hypothetical protein WCY88_17085 [Spongiibacteraceae bacterium]
MTLNWIETSHTSPLNIYSGEQQYTVFATHIDGSNDNTFKRAIAEIIEKAISVLHINISDNSRYLLFEWDQNTTTLTVVVTDDHKAQDSMYALSCQIQGFDSQSHAESAETPSEMIRYCLTNYLTTCSSFMHFSLVALYHDGSRNKTVLL